MTPILPVVGLSRASGFYPDRLGLKDLEGRGVGFLDYDTPEIKTIDHVCVMGDEKAAWFADSEGNFLCLHERVIGDMGR